MPQPYRQILAIPHLPTLMLWAMVARLQFGGLPIAVTFLVTGWTGSYALAGVVVGGLTIGMAVAGPLRGRMADNGAADRLMLTCGLVYSAGLVLLCLLPAALWWSAIPLALLTGLFMPPSGQIGRSLWARLSEGRTRRAVYAVDATLQELVFVIGPLVAAVAVAYAGGRVALAALALLTLVGSVGFARALRRAGLARTPRPDTRLTGGGSRSLLVRAPVVLLTVLCLLLVGGLGAVDLGIVAWAREMGVPGYAGALAAIWALGSVVGGLVAGALPGTPRLASRALAAALGLAVLVPLLPPVLHLPSPWLVSPVLFLAGLAIAPTLAATTARLGEITPEHRRAEAFGWLNTAATAGIAGSAPLAGWLIDIGGVAAGFACGALLALAAAVIGALLPGAPERESRG